MTRDLIFGIFVGVIIGIVVSLWGTTSMDHDAADIRLQLEDGIMVCKVHSGLQSFDKDHNYTCGNGTVIHYNAE